MASHIKGITVILYEVTKTGEDPVGAPIYAETPVQVDNVLVEPVGSSEVLDNLNLYGRKAVYTLGLPKGDNHEWDNRKVSFFGQDFRVFGLPIEGIEENIPLDWNKKITVEKYE